MRKFFKVFFFILIYQALTFRPVSGQVERMRPERNDVRRSERLERDRNKEIDRRLIDRMAESSAESRIRIAENGENTRLVRDRIRGEKRFIADAIANGDSFNHDAFVKHGLFKGEFKGLEIRTRKQFSQFIESIIESATGDNFKLLERGRAAFWDKKTRSIVIYDPNRADKGTAFRPTEGRSYFDYKVK